MLKAFSNMRVRGEHLRNNENRSPPTFLSLLIASECLQDNHWECLLEGLGFWLSYFVNNVRLELLVLHFRVVACGKKSTSDRPSSSGVLALPKPFDGYLQVIAEYYVRDDVHYLSALELVVISQMGGRGVVQEGRIRPPLISTEYQGW
ncbi:hypothetical protein CEXT_209151 [Caerostris extrusa]|uniref:Uncharacterized protein n=1 Tax=Caerostris extrusa TaxID=172846 RepID=A0AAV4MEX6_CAEEX|nr:hypothetical protein CEXT_209151 [Caerostris extrusa]